MLVSKRRCSTKRKKRHPLGATEESFDDVISTNLKGTSDFLTQEAANLMIEQRKNDP